LSAANSPLIGQGSNPGGLIIDQRGFTRVVGAKPDIGAVEVQNPALVVFHGGDSGNGSLRQAIADANVLAGANTVTFDGEFFSAPQTITLEAGELVISEAVTIAGPGPALA